MIVKAAGMPVGKGGKLNWKSIVKGSGLHVVSLHTDLGLYEAELADGSMKDDYQGAYIMALRFVIPAGALWDRVFAKLVEKVKAEGMQTGFLPRSICCPCWRTTGRKSWPTTCCSARSAPAGCTR